MNWRKPGNRCGTNPGRGSAWIMMLMSLSAFSQVELRFDQNETVTWQACIEMYQWLDGQYEDAVLMEAGWTDAGKPLHLFIISKGGEFSPEWAHKEGKSILVINNGIHPGESCGVDASLKLAEGLLAGKDTYARFLDSTVVVIVPLFNVGGALNRSPYNRANQNGPLEQGFRGNARNLDLNRDFIKMDSKNTRSLVKILREWDPHIFIDTHTSNGADYTYALTLINSHEQRHELSQSAFLRNTLVPSLYDAMSKTPYEMGPYVWPMGSSPETGIQAFLDYPRYTSGYVSLFNTYAFTIETHMFKSYQDRVQSTWYLLREILKFTGTHSGILADLKMKAWEEKLERKQFTLQWGLDTSRCEMIPFKGYRSKWKPSTVTGHMRQYYDREDPYEMEIPYYKYFKSEVSVDVPQYYILPSAWAGVVKRLRINQVEMQPIRTDTSMEVEVYLIEKYETLQHPYNGHYLHFNVEVRKEIRRVQLFSGDFIVPVRQKAIEYLVQTLEPGGYDSFFSWNFFDEVLFRNEYFSPYIFEETAEELLKSDPELRQQFESERLADPDFANSPYQQLRFIYERSPWGEKTYMRYPVFRM